jgi:ATP-dependent helicase/nuclease subunit A
MLVSRILRALLDGAEPQQILAITFTRKAAGEMRERLDAWLAEFAAPAASEAQRIEALRERGLSAVDAAALAPALGALQGRLLEAARGVELRTFHGWFAQLVAHAPLTLLERIGLPPRAELVEDPGLLRAELFRRFHRAVQADAALRVDYLGLVREHRRGSLLQWLDAAWQRATELECAIAAGTLDGSVPPPAEIWPECVGLADPRELLQREPLRAELDTLARALGAVGRAKTDEAADRLRSALEAADPARAFDLAWEALFTGKGEPRKQIGDGAAIAAASAALQRLRTMLVQQAAHQDHLRMARLARVLLAEYAALKRERGVADMADLERAALALLGDSAAAGWVQQRLDQRLRHLLIDEFQDTSPLQWQALHGWLSSYAGAGGGASGQRPPSVFIVGDPKQSIYRFRRAEPRVFEAARGFVTLGLGGQVLECDHTRRNAAAVLDALNALFVDAAHVDGWTPFRAHTTGASAAGSVLALPGVGRPPREGRGAASGVWRDSLTQPRREPEAVLREQEAAQIADAVAALIAAHGLRPGEVMVLARKRSVLRRVAAALAARHLPHVQPEALALAEAPAALDLIALLDVLASPGHDLSLARALKSPLFGAADADLLWLAREARSRRCAWRDALLAACALPSPALARAQRLLGGWRDAAERLPPHDLLDRIVDEGELDARVAAAVPADRRAAALQAVQALLAAALAQDGGRHASLYAFVRALKSGQLDAPAAVPGDAVQLLTVHGAKGLEARAVIVADADPEPRPPERATLLVDWPVEAGAPRRVAFVRSEAQVAPSLAALLADEARARGREELNGLYVAMTRAREWLVFAHTDPFRRANGRSWWQRVEALARPWQPAAVPVAAPTVEVALPVLPRLAAAAPVPPRESALDPAAARLGQAVHRALEWVGQPGRSVEPQRAAQAAAEAFGVDAAAVQAVVAAIVGSADCARFFTGPALRWAGNELPMADADGASLRIDRLVLLTDDGADAAPTWWVLDYKLRAAPAELPAYREQMARYRQAVRAAQPGALVRCGFITGGGALVEI